MIPFEEVNIEEINYKTPSKVDSYYKSEISYKGDDLVIITKGDLAGIEGGTNAIKVVKVGHLVEV